MDFIKSTDHRPTKQWTHRTIDSIIVFQKLGYRKIFDSQTTHTSEKIIFFYYVFVEQYLYP